MVAQSKSKIARVIFLGPPGAGKGTQAILLARDRGLAHISTGEIMRAAISEGSELGNRIKAVLDRGELVSDSQVLELVREAITRPAARNGFVLDGFPRNLNQAVSLNTIMKGLGQEVTHVIELNVPQDVLLERIRKRGEAQGRSDDSEEVAARRLEVYWEQTAPVTAYYAKEGKVFKVDGLGTVEEVYERISKVL